jgi:outer membrane lipoprotein-sorting protein
MKSPQHPNPAPARALAALALAALTLPLSGCFLSTHTRAVRKVTVIPNVKTATIDQLLDQISRDYNNTKTLTATVEITATTGGQHQGEVKEIPTFAGYIVLRKPADLHIQMLLPVVRSRALEMVSDGKDFKLYIPPKDRAAIGKDEPTSSSPKGFENLRPYIIRDALLIPPMQPDEQVALVEDSRVIEPRPGQKDALEEPDYDLIIFRPKQAQQLELVRVIHIGRATLRPYEQDIYDHTGHIVTKVAYDKFQKFGDNIYPQTILITRPIDEYSLKIEFSKITFNLPVDDESFILNIPASVPIQKMN